MILYSDSVHRSLSEGETSALIPEALVYVITPDYHIKNIFPMYTS
jgi:hypothetical protein